MKRPIENIEPACRQAGIECPILKVEVKQQMCIHFIIQHSLFDIGY